MRELTVDQVVGLNIRRSREERGWTQAELAERVEILTGERWDYSKVSRAEVSPENPRDPRPVSTRELVGMALALDVSVIELMTPPPDVDGEPVKVRVGVDAVAPDAAFRLMFMLPPSFRRRQAWDLAFAEGPSSQVAWLAGILREAIAALYAEEQLEGRFPDVERLGVAELTELYAANEERIIEWIIDRYGVDVAVAVVDSPRGREWASRTQETDKEGRR